MPITTSTPRPSSPPAFRRTIRSLRVTCVVAAAATLVLFAPPAVRAAVFPATLITQEGDATLVGAEGVSVVDLSYPITTGLGALGFNGRLDTGEGPGDGFVWFDGEIVWRASEWGAGLIGSSSRGFSDAGGWLSRETLEGAAALWTHQGLLQRIGDAVPWGSDLLTVRQIALPGEMSAEGAAYWRGQFEDLDGHRYWLVARSRTATGGDVDFEVMPDARFGGYPMARPYGVIDFDLGRSGTHRVLSVVLDVDGSRRAAVVVDETIVAMQGGLTGGLPGERWGGGRRVAVDSRGESAFTTVTSTQGTPWIVAFRPAPSDDEAAPPAAVVLRDGDCVGTEGGLDPCVTLEPDSEPRTVALSDAGAMAHLWIEPMGLGGDEYLFFSCDPQRAREATLLLSRYDGVDLDGDGFNDAIVDRVGLPGEQQVAFGPRSLYVGAELLAPSGTIEAILELELPVCSRSSS